MSFLDFGKLIEMLLSADDFIEELLKRVLDRLLPDGEDEAEIADLDMDAIWKEFEPRLMSLVDSRIHKVEKRIADEVFKALKEIESQFLEKANELLAAAKDSTAVEVPEQSVTRAPKSSSVKLTSSGGVRSVRQLRSAALKQRS